MDEEHKMLTCNFGRRCTIQKSGRVGSHSDLVVATAFESIIPEVLPIHLPV